MTSDIHWPRIVVIGRYIWYTGHPTPLPPPTPGPASAAVGGVINMRRRKHAPKTIRGQTEFKVWNGPTVSWWGIQSISLSVGSPCAPPLAHRSGVFRAHGASIVRRYFTRLQLIRELVLTWNMGSYAVEFTSFSSPRSHRWLLTAYIQAKRHVSDSIDFGYRSCVEADTAAGQGQLNVCSWNSRWFYEFAVLHYQFTAVSRLWRLTVRLMSADTLANSITYS